MSNIEITRDGDRVLVTIGGSRFLMERQTTRCVLYVEREDAAERPFWEEVEDDIPDGVDDLLSALYQAAPCQEEPCTTD